MLAILVLGHAFYNGKLTLRQQKRLYKALELRERSPEAILVTTGGFGLFNTSDKSLAEHQKEFLMAKGIPKNKIFTENKSKNTIENARFSLPILKENNIDKIIVVSSWPHIVRAKYIFTKLYPENINAKFEISDMWGGIFFTMIDLIWELAGWAKRFINRNLI